MPQFPHNPGILPANRTTAQTAYYAACKLYGHWFSSGGAGARLVYESNISQWLTVIGPSDRTPSGLSKASFARSPVMRMARALQLTEDATKNGRSRASALAHLKRLLNDGIEKSDFGMVSAAVHGYARINYKRGLQYAFGRLAREVKAGKSSAELIEGAKLIRSYLRKNHSEAIRSTRPRS